uniref:Uncharacterized protein n=1 Tax=Graphocephala atropunctata TaxID=36148 RepID=A0A1B6MTC5_9HEMI
MFSSCLRNVLKFKSVEIVSILSQSIETKFSVPITNVVIRHCSNVLESDKAKESEEQQKSKKGGFAQAYDKFTVTEHSLEIEEPSFLSLLKKSKFVDLGDPEGKIVTGTIFHVVDDDLYVDFGWKFHCVVTRPPKNGHEYVRGARVRLSLKDLELSSRFLGSEKDLTLLEADATLVGLVSSPARLGAIAGS